MDIILLLQDFHLQKKRKREAIFVYTLTAQNFQDCVNVWTSQTFLVGFPDSSVGKESTCNAGDPGWFPGLGRSFGEGIGYPLQYSWVSLVAQLVKHPPAMRKTWLWSLGWEDPLEKGKATHSSILAWRIPCIVHGVAKSWTILSNFNFTNLPQQQPWWVGFFQKNIQPVAWASEFCASDSLAHCPWLALGMIQAKQQLRLLDQKTKSRFFHVFLIVCFIWTLCEQSDLWWLYIQSSQNLRESPKIK